MRDPDPENLPNDYRPAFLWTVDGERVFSAHVILKDNGWVRHMAWDGTIEYVPPRRVHKLRRVETETHDQLDAAVRIADAQQREKAHELGRVAEESEVIV